MSTPAIVSGLKTGMQHLASRQRVIAENIANSETPGYKSRDLEAPDFGSMLSSVGAGGGMPGVAKPRVELTDAMRGLGAIQPMGAGGVILDTDIVETKPDGNNVTIEDQLLKMGEIQADFTALTNLYRKQMGFLKAAIGKGG